MKVILNVDPEIGETDNFLWTEEEEPPRIRSNIKKRPLADDEDQLKDKDK